MFPRKSTDTGLSFHTASSVPKRNRTQSATATSATAVSGRIRTTSTTTSYFQKDAPTPADLAARLEALKESGVRRLPLTRLCSSTELLRLRPALRSHLTDLAYLSDCAAYQYPRAANGRDLALVLRASAVLRALDGGSTASLSWHMAQMFSVVLPPTATCTIYDSPPTHLHGLGLEIAPPAPNLGLGMRVEFLSPHQFATPVPIPADNGDMATARAAIRSYTAARGVLPTVWEGAYFPWLLTHVLPPTASFAEGETGALASLRVASRLTTRLYAAARRNHHHTPIPVVMSRCYALVAIGHVWTLYAGVLEGDLMVSEIATVNAADPEGLMAALSLVRTIAGEAEERRAVLENWLWCLEPPASSPLSTSSSGSLPVTPDSAAGEQYGNLRPVPLVPLQEKAFENPRCAPTPSPPNTKFLLPPPRPPPRRIPVPPSNVSSSPPTSPTSTRRMGIAISPSLPVAIGKGRSPVLDVGAWRQAVRRSSAQSARPSGLHRLNRSVS
ncbi:hypothetical protein CspeluHIS016_0802320 [Cutaneotrichosporon spelunceum]|uniref:Uncharacterized protein n=1 Tax=Cutaneotrichosporon spelunceum TaxID=1672016 RepID=A0AAD3TZW0_9TREE|nr:hypothetical protein CspeluHIS016_0802320 [Cutaneotrichosporon spelunceum]